MPHPARATQVASAGRAVLLSVHQPSPAMFALLDRVLLLAQVGRGAPVWRALLASCLRVPVLPS